MRIDRLDLTAFGSFTDVQLDLSKPGLHLIYGPNEAGKSTALEAVDNLLYDIPVRTTYDFVHTKDKMQLGARISDNTGEVLEVIRRKRRNDPLIEKGTDRPIEPDEWRRYLGGLERGDFAALFSLGWEQLLAGTAELLRREGRAGETLFAAGLGVVQLGKVLDTLKEDAAKLFAPRGPTKAVNKALADHKEALRRVKEYSVKPSSFDQTEKAYEKATGRRKALEADRRRLDAEKDRLLVLVGALPRIIERSQKLGERDELRSEGVVASPSWVQRVVDALGEKQRLVADKATTKSSIDALDSKLAAVVVEEEVLTAGEHIDMLAEGIADYLTGLADRVKRAEERGDAERDAVAVLSTILGRPASPEDFTGLAGPIAAMTKARAVRDRWVRAETSLEKAAETTESLKGELERVEEDLSLIAEERDMTRLQVALDAVRAEGNLDATLESARAVLSDATEARDTLAGQLELAGDEIGVAVAGAMPGSEEVEQILGLLSEATSDARLASDQAAKARLRAEGFEADLLQLAQGSDLPGLDDLNEKRVARNSLWSKIRSSWLGTGEDLWEPTEEHADSYDAATGEADEVADRLWGEAEETAKRAQLVKDTDAARSEETLASQAAVEAGRRGDDAYRSWRQRWPAQKIPESPASLRDWEKKMARLVERYGVVQEAQGAHRAVARKVAAHRRRLCDALEQLGESPVAGPHVGPLAAQAKSVLDVARKAASDRAGLADRKARIEAKQPKAVDDADKARDAVAAASHDFSDVLGPVASDIDSSEAAGALLGRLEQLGKSLTDRDSLTRRIDGIDRRSTRFEAAVSGLLAKAPDISPTPPEAAARQLVARLVAARGNDAKRQSTQQSIDEAMAKLEGIEGSLSGCEATLSQLAHEKRLGDVTELDATAQRSKQVNELSTAIADLEAEIVRQGRGRSLAELEADVQATDANALDDTIDDVKSRLEEVSSELSEVMSEQAELAQSLKAMDTSAAGAIAAEEANSAWASVAESSERFIRLVLTYEIATEAIRRYSEAHQDELLDAASRYFRRLTLDGYSSIVVNGGMVGSGDGPGVVLGARCLDGAEKEMDQLSSGTRDELYFALRLASLEASVSHYGPMPVLLDDVLVNFDDSRAAAALVAVAEIAEATQVLLFTHHHHVVDLAKAALKSGSVNVHELTVPVTSSL